MFNASHEYAVASKYSSIRLVTLSQVQSNKPLYDVDSLEQDWSVASKGGLLNFCNHNTQDGS